MEKPELENTVIEKEDASESLSFHLSLSFYAIIFSINDWLMQESNPNG